MYKFLIVDDEKIERDGIKLLVKKYNLELEIAEAENGRTALDYIKNNHVDVLFTDIKMPFMNGLELAEQAKMLRPGLKVIIYSAFGEFDYARKAINIKVEHYLLKPISKTEFLSVFNQVLEDCRRDEEESLRSQKIMEIYHKGIQYEKEKVLLDIINGAEINDEFSERMKIADLNFQDKYIKLMLVDFRNRFFDIYDQNFKTLIKEFLGSGHEYLNLNERQSLIFVFSEEKFPGRDFFAQLGNSLISEITSRYQMQSTVVFSETVTEPALLEYEMNKIEQVLDSKFFHDSSRVLFTCKADSQENNSAYIEAITESIFKSIDEGNWKLLQNETSEFFNYLKGKASFSTIYVKYTCTEIVKRVSTKINKMEDKQYILTIESIFKSKTLEQLKDYTQGILDGLDRSVPDAKKPNAKAIKQALDYIKDHYMEDISVEFIAEKQYLTPNYFNMVFKKEIGQSVGKYITYYRLKMAEELLKNTNMKIIEIGQSVGYTNNSYFCLLFKNYYGMTPIKYRETVG